MKTLTNAILFLFLVTLFSCNHSANNSVSIFKVHDNGVNIAYTYSGSGDTTLVFVHGWIINKSYWTNQVAFFSKNYRVVTIDLPGFGESGKNRASWTIKDFGRDVDSVMDQLNLKNVVLIGHSMSGNVVLEAALHDPDRVIGIVGIDNFLNVGQPEDPKAKASYTDAIAQLKKNFKKVTTQYFNQDLFYKTTADSIKKRILNDVNHADSTIAIASMEGSYDEVPNLKALKKKLYLLNSDIHQTYTGGFKADSIPYELKEIHATGHYPMIEKPNDFNMLLNAIIADIKKDNK